VKTEIISGKSIHVIIRFWKKTNQSANFLGMVRIEKPDAYIVFI
jgi:hypothetical protein